MYLHGSHTDRPQRFLTDITQEALADRLAAGQEAETSLVLPTSRPNQPDRLRVDQEVKEASQAQNEFRARVRRGLLAIASAS